METGKKVCLKSVASGKNLKCDERGAVSGQGGKGKWAQWDVIPGNADGTVRLRNVGNPAHFLCVFHDGRLHAGKGGKLCDFRVVKGKAGTCLKAVNNSCKKAHVGILGSGKAKNAKKTRRGKCGCFEVEVLGDAESEEEIQSRYSMGHKLGRAGDDDEFEAHIDPEKKKALLVGCNYPGTSAALRGCVNDVFMMQDVLINIKGFKPENIRVMVDTDAKYERPTGWGIKRALKQLVGGSKKGDVLFWHFSGHGTQVPAEGPDHEKDMKDEAIVPTDMNLIVDDDLREIMEDLPPGVHFTAVTDCCHSGGMLDHGEVQIGEKSRAAPPPAHELWGARDLKPEETSRALPIEVLAAELTKGAGQEIKPTHTRRALFGLFGSESSSLASGFVSFFAEASGLFSYDNEESDDEDEYDPNADLFNSFFGAPAAPPDVVYQPANPAPPSQSLMHLFAVESPAALYTAPLPPTFVPPPVGPERKPEVDEQLEDEKGVLICGCQSHQTSADCTPPGQPHKAYGALTNTLTKMVKANPSISAEDLVADARRSLGTSGFSQQPGLECTQFHAQQPFICPSV